jgi:hypothetical protein
MKLTRIGEIRQAGRQAKLYNRNLLEAFEKGAQWADAHPENKWRSVKDVLPTTNGDVLVVDILGECYVSCFEDGGWYDNSMEVTHWMPLPEFPELPENE